MTVRRALLLSLTAALLIPSAAGAATRYASPTGTGPAATCPQADPCSLQVAVENAAVQDGDEVIVITGAVPYNESNMLDVGDAITVGKQAGAARPTINTTAGGVLVNDPGAVIRDLAINQTAGTTALLVVAGTAERMQVRTTQANACTAVSSTNALLRDSTCLNANPVSGVAIAATIGAFSGTFVSRLRNVTGYALGTSSIGLNATANSGASLSVDARNVIVSGGSTDVRADFTAPSPATVVTMTSSNYATEDEVSAGSTITNPGTGGNQIAEPLLANPAGLDFTQLAGSPTINAGTIDGFLGSSDLTGGPRVGESAPDIGADEVAPDTSISSGPEPVARNNRPMFTFSSNEAVATFECRIGSAAFQACASPFTSETLEQGSYAFAVRAIDSGGNPDSTPAAYAFAIDRGVSGANASAKRVQRQRGRRVSLSVSVKATEDVRVSAAAKLRLTKKKSFTLKSKAVDLDAGNKRMLELKPQKKSASRKILKKLKQGRKVKAILSATFEDAVGNEATTGKIVVKLKD